MTSPAQEATTDGRSVPHARPGHSKAYGRSTKILAGAIVAGVVVQAALAGGFLAGRATFRDLHEYLGYVLLAAGSAVLVVGLLGRRRSEVTVRLPTRVGLALALGVTVFVGMRAGRGSSDLLMLHIPLAFGILALATRLIVRESIDRYVSRPRGRVGRSNGRTPADGHTSER